MSWDVILKNLGLWDMSCNCQEAASILARCYGKSQPREPRSNEMFRSWTADIVGRKKPPQARGEKRARVTRTKRVAELEKEVAELKKQAKRITPTRITPTPTARITPTRITPTVVAPTRVTPTAPTARGNLQQEKKTRAFDVMRDRQFDRWILDKLEDEELEEYTARRRAALSVPRKVRRRAMGLPRRQVQGRQGKRRK